MPLNYLCIPIAVYFQCNICDKHDCPVRQKPFENRIDWNLDGLLSDAKHSL